MPYTPWTNRKIGIEMEMNTSRSGGRGNVSLGSIASALTRGGVPSVNQMGYGRSNGTTWDVKTDGSCGFEVASPAMMLDADGHNADLRSACAALKEDLHVRVDRRCGLHVHVECTDFSWRDLQKLIALWLRYEPFFFEMLPESRRSNNYCQPLRASAWARALPMRTAAYDQMLAMDNEQEFTRAASAMFTNRYMSLNLTGFWRHKRIEFRLHSGTVEYDKIRNWAILLLALVARVKAADAPPLARKVQQPKPELGFRPEHVLRMLGLGATAWTEDSQVARDVARYVAARRAQHSAR